MALARPAGVSLANWRTPPWSPWSFQHVQELVPCAWIRSTRQSEEPPLGAGVLAPFLDDPVLADTDSLALSVGGRLAAEWYAPHVDPDAPHLLFSVTKSVTGLVAGILIERGELDPAAPVGAYVPECTGSAYEDVAVRHLLDMSVAIDFEEAYLDPDHDYGRYRRATLWNPMRPGDQVETLADVLFGAPRAPHPHGTVYAYRSVNTDMAGIVLERASGRRWHELVEDLLWLPMGAHHDATITVDRAGTARAAGGLSVTTRDLLRLGQLVADGGGGVIPPSVVAELFAGGDRAAWAVGDHAALFPGGSYRSYWYSTGQGELCAIGIHGQWIWIDPTTSTVLVRTASQADPADEALEAAQTALWRRVCRP